MKTTTLTHPLITAEHLARKGMLYVRQSSLEQVERNVGSQAFQRSQVDLARAYGWPDDLIEVIDDDLGKSGSSVERRTGWQRMLEEIAANKVGIVFATNFSRLGREYLALEKLRLLAQYHGTLLCIENRIIDPTDEDDTFMTRLGAGLAQLDNSKRTRQMSQARMAKARQGAVVSLLPVGWIEIADGKYDYDPAVKDTISAIIDTFMNVRSIRQTVKALIKEGIKVPA